MNDRKTTTNPQQYDAIVIGAGICGIIFLKYAREQGLHCQVLEKQDAVEGLWNRLPAWQDIQNRKEDFAIDDLALHGVKQPDVVEYIRKWVQEYKREPFIKLQHEVKYVSCEDETWQVQTNRGTFTTNYLISATGVQNGPWTPDIKRSHVEVNEMHSSNLRRPENLAGQKVTVVGGGASAWDLLDLAIKNCTKEIHWVYRNVRWFWPTTRTKQTFWPNLRELSIIQTVTSSAASVNNFNRWLLKKF